MLIPNQFANVSAFEKEVLFDDVFKQLIISSCSNGYMAAVLCGTLVIPSPYTRVLPASQPITCHMSHILTNLIR